MGIGLLLLRVIWSFRLAQWEEEERSLFGILFQMSKGAVLSTILGKRSWFRELITHNSKTLAPMYLSWNALKPKQRM